MSQRDIIEVSPGIPSKCAPRPSRGRGGRPRIIRDRPRRERNLAADGGIISRIESPRICKTAAAAEITKITIAVSRDIPRHLIDLHCRYSLPACLLIDLHLHPGFLDSTSSTKAFSPTTSGCSILRTIQGSVTLL